MILKRLKALVMMVYFVLYLVSSMINVTHHNSMPLSVEYPSVKNSVPLGPSSRRLSEVTQSASSQMQDPKAY